MTETDATNRIAVLGAGVMGSSIAAMALGHSLDVTLVDIDAATLDQATTRINTQLRMATLMGAVPAGRSRGRLTTGSEPEAAGDCTAVIEAIIEDTGAKAEVLARVSAVVRPGTPLVTNTSSIPVDELAEAARRPDEVVGTHFMNPAYLIRTVEVIKGVRTSSATMDAVRALLAAMDREPIVVRDAPGFVTSRIAHPMINTAIQVVQEGTATVEDVDALMQGCLGHPTGPLRTADLIGLDNLADSLTVLLERTGDESCRPCDLLLEKVSRGDLGRKSGRGFYDYKETVL
ncbi:3-hydroxyacyl-CoA dehydrogenase family protein [Micromonospora parva]|uniref:3-hydroxyacyl-CoA dehydrogenase family protein n=1 Tax=Micromonospora parva TaxID=1464048 RepID=UPI0033CF6EB0